jgi:hypothetical protein
MDQEGRMNPQGKFASMLQKLRDEYSARLAAIAHELRGDTTNTVMGLTRIVSLKNEATLLSQKYERVREYDTEMRACPHCYVVLGQIFPLDGDLEFCATCGTRYDKDGAVISS